MSGVDLPGVIAGVVALMILVDVSVLWGLGKPVPELLSYMATTVFGFYFGRDRGNGGGGPTGRSDAGGEEVLRDTSVTRAPVIGGDEAKPGARRGTAGLAGAAGASSAQGTS